jgi:hypothetical protein
VANIEIFLQSIEIKSVNVHRKPQLSHTTAASHEALAVIPWMKTATTACPSCFSTMGHATVIQSERHVLAGRRPAQGVA